MFIWASTSGKQFSNSRKSRDLVEYQIRQPHQNGKKRVGEHFEQTRGCWRNKAATFDDGFAGNWPRFLVHGHRVFQRSNKHDFQESQKTQKLSKFFCKFINPNIQSRESASVCSQKSNPFIFFTGSPDLEICEFCQKSCDKSKTLFSNPKISGCFSTDLCTFPDQNTGFLHRKILSPKTFSLMLFKTIRSS